MSLNPAVSGVKGILWRRSVTPLLSAALWSSVAVLPRGRHFPTTAQLHFCVGAGTTNPDSEVNV